jgi:small subunit ribosomal protein S20
MVRSATRTTVKNAEAVIAAGDPEAARAAVRGAIAYLDRAAKKGVIHANAAARRKSRLVLKYNAAVAAVQAPAAEAEAPKRRATKTAKPAKPASSRAKKPKK